jgi:hypothetical protein
MPIPGRTLNVLHGASESGGAPGSKDRPHPDSVVQGTHRVFVRSNAEPEPDRFSWVGRACSICFRNSFVVRLLRASHRPAAGIARMTVMSSCKALPIHGWEPSRWCGRRCS